MARNRRDGDGGKEIVTDGADGKEEHTDGDRSLIDRRSYLKLAGATAATAVATPSAAGLALAASDDPDISFGRTVNVVEEFDADPTGGRAVNGAIDRAARNGTMLVFPEGTYRFNGAVRLTNLGRIGFRGEGDVRFVPPRGFNHYLINVEVGRFVFENIDIDIRQGNTNAGFRIHATHAYRLQDVEVIGRGTHSNTDVKNMLNTSVGNPDGVGLVRNLVAKKGSGWAHYNSGSGRVGIHTGGRHRGTLRVVDCHMEEFGNNALYCSRCPGNVQVVGGFYRNNNVASVRISGENSYVDGATIVVDPDAYTGPRSGEGRAFNMRGIVIESANAGTSKPRGAEIHNCNIVIRRNPTGGRAINIWSNGRTARIFDTNIRMDNDAPAIRRDGRNYQGNNPPANGARWVHMRNVHITGSTSGGPTVDVRHGDWTRIENCCIRQTGNNRDGIVLRNSDNCIVENSVIDVPGQALRLISSAADTENLSDEGTCAEPSTEADSGNDRSDDGDDAASDRRNTLVIDGNGSSERTEYRFVVDGEVERSATLSEYGVGGEIAADGTVEGFVRGGKDGFVFDGEVTSLTLSRDGPTVFLNGEAVDPDDRWSSDADEGEDDANEPSRTLVIDGEGGTERRQYYFQIDGRIERSEELSEYGVGGEIADDGTVEGFVRGGKDGFVFDGEIVSFEIEDGPTVTVDGEVVDPDEFGEADDGNGDVDETDGSSLPHTIVLEEADDTGPTTYRFEVSGDLEKGEHANENDVVDGTVAIGTIEDGRDSYHFSGYITTFEVDGRAAITFESNA